MPGTWFSDGSRQWQRSSSRASTRPSYTPFLDTGDHVVVINAAKVKLTGRKEEQKLYRFHSGYEGGLREERAKDVRQKNPVRIVEQAIRGHVAEVEARRRHVSQAEGLPRRGSSARRAEANPVQGSLTWQSSSTTAPAAARRRPRACSCGPAPGAINVNRRNFEEFFPTGLPARAGPAAAAADRDRRQVRRARDRGGRRRGRPGRARSGSASPAPSCDYNVELRGRLKKEGLLTRDARAKERKKYGMAGARKRFQFSKR